MKELKIIEMTKCEETEMTTEELILPYKLEQHLTEICNSSATYKNLLSVWNINKKMCQDVLNTVVMNYPHYTNHDVSHCEAIITNIEMLLEKSHSSIISYRYVAFIAGSVPA